MVRLPAVQPLSMVMTTPVRLPDQIVLGSMSTMIKWRLGSMRGTADRVNEDNWRLSFVTLVKR